MASKVEKKAIHGILFTFIIDRVLPPMKFCARQLVLTVRSSKFIRAGSDRTRDVMNMLGKRWRSIIHFMLDAFGIWIFGAGASIDTLLEAA